jgi:hypothetical protein
MTKEALKLALEALEEWLPTVPVLIEKKKSAITAIKEALAQPEQKSVAMADYMALTEKYVALKATQRTWVGLTKEERHEISMANRPYCADIMAAHEEELKRRNT